MTKKIPSHRFPPGMFPPVDALAFIGWRGGAVILFGERFQWIGEARKRLARDKELTFLMAGAAIVNVRTETVEDPCDLTPAEVRDLEGRIRALPRVGTCPCGGPMVMIAIPACLWCAACPEREAELRRAATYSEARNVAHLADAGDFEGALLAEGEALDE